MNAKSSRIFSYLHAGGTALLLAFFGQAWGSVIALPAVQKFDTEILSLHLTGQGLLPLPDPRGGFSDVPVIVDISPTPGARHLGQMTVTPGTGTLHPIDSFFDVFFDVTFKDPSSGSAIIPTFSESARITGRNMGAPDALGHFSPGGHYSGSGMLTHNIGGVSFDITYVIDLDFGGAYPPDPIKEGTLHMFDALAQFSGNINPPFGPFQLSNPTTEPVRILVRDVPEPGTLALFGLGLLGVALRRSSATAPGLRARKALA